MPGDVRFSSAPQPPKYGGPPPRKRPSRSKLFAALGAAGSIVVLGGAAVAWKYEKTILRIVHRAPVPPPRAVPVAEFLPFKTLSDFKGVECFYTAKFVEPLPAPSEPAPVNLLPMSRLIVQKIVRESGDYDHPNSSGYKLYAMTQNALALPSPDNTSGTPVHLLDTLVVLYPVIGQHDEVLELHLCPVTAFKKAQDLWLDRSFKYAGAQVGGIEIDPGTIVTVTDVSPDHFAASGVAFDLSLKLPGGETVHQSINPDNMGLLQALDQKR